VKLGGRSALVTGGGSGIGKAIALLFAAEGASVLVADIDDEAGQAVVNQIKESVGVATFIHTDTSSEDEVKAAIQAALDRYARIDILVNNAGIGGPAYSWDRTIAVNLSGVYYGCRHGLRAMLKQGGGVIINMSSLAGLRGGRIPGLRGGFGYAYVATKHAVIGLTKQFALSGAPTVRVNCICPGGVQTAYYSQMEGADVFLDWTVANTPLGRLAQPEEIARGALFLASDDSSFMTGTLLIMDGGSTAK
jgi:NAD(P)-dependent dehydrogenase (short-subunit alcohol dehydrogenase family)